MDKFLKIAIVLSAIDKASSVITNAVGKSSKEMEKLGRSNRIAEGMDRIGNRALLAGTAMTGFFAATVAAAADVEKMQISLRTAFQGNEQAAQQAFETINKFAARTPFQLEEVMMSFVKLKNMGLDPSTRALESYGNTASAMGKSLNDMIEAVADATTGEFERLKEFGIKAKSEGDRVTFTFRGVSTTMRKDAASIESYLLKIGETQFAGGIEAQSKSINGQMSTLQDNFKMASAAMGKALIPALTRVMQAVTPLIERFAKWAEKNPELIATIAGLGVGLGALGAVLKVASAAMIVFNSAIWANPITWIVVAILAAIAAVVAMVAKWKELVAWFKQTSPLVKVLLAPLIMALGPLILVAYAIRKVMDNWGAISKFFIDMWRKIDGAFTNGVNTVSNFIKEFSPKKLIYDVWNGIVAYFQRIWNEVTFPIRAAIAFLKTVAKEFYEAGKNIVMAIYEGIKAAARLPITAVEEMVGKMRDMLPFSPAKTGPFRDIHKVKIVETIADSMKPSVLSNKMAKVVGDARATLNASITGRGPMMPNMTPNAVAGGGSSVSYAPVVTINGGGPTAELNFRKMLDEHRNEIVRLIQQEQLRSQRTSFA